MSIYLLTIASLWEVKQIFSLKEWMACETSCQNEMFCQKYNMHYIGQIALFVGFQNNQEQIHSIFSRKTFSEQHSYACNEKQNMI